jgi:hypothetical protein
MSVPEARANLVELVEQVTTDPQEEVVIEHCGPVRGRSFKLKGSMQLTVPPDEFDEWFEENRRRASSAADAKFSAL